MSDNPLPKAHALSAHASLLLGAAHPPLPALQDARGAYVRAADLFSEASIDAADEGAKRTLQLLVSQNRKLAKDVERRIASRDNGESPGPSRRASASGPSGMNETGPSTPTPRAAPPTPAVESKRRFKSFGHTPTDTFTNLAVSPGVPSIPPFALRPSTAPRALSLGSVLSSPPDPAGTGPFGSSTTSPLYSSSSSSEPPDESYVNFGATPETLDPFSRFWARLDNMLDDISNPVKFASATVGPLPEVRSRPKRKEKSRERPKEEGTSPSGSYYLVPPTAKDRSSKTPEELALENEHLRASLDALAVHASALDKANAVLREQAEERDKVMQSVVVGVRREARKAKHGAELMRSQLLQQSSLSPRIGEDDGLRRRVRELEDEVVALKADNEKQKSHVAKYKERFEKIKVNARAKKAAREGSEPVEAG